MKISIERGALLKAVGQAQSVVERRNTIPILANVLLRREGDEVEFITSDLEIQVRSSCCGSCRSTRIRTSIRISFSSTTTPIPIFTATSITTTTNNHHWRREQQTKQLSEQQ